MRRRKYFNEAITRDESRIKMYKTKKGWMASTIKTVWTMMFTRNLEDTTFRISNESTLKALLRWEPFLVVLWGCK